VPVATVAIGAARNAALLAVRMLGIGDPQLRAAIERSQVELASHARAQDERVRVLRPGADPGP